MRKLVLCSALLIASGCAHSPLKRAYVAGSVTTEVVEESHKIFDDRAKEALAKCDPEKNSESEVKTKTDLDKCMGSYNVHVQEGIVKALAIYNAAATAYSAVLLGCQPNEDGTPVNAATCAKKTFTGAELRAWRGKIIEAGIEALKQFPDAGAKVAKLQSLVR